MNENTPLINTIIKINEIDPLNLKTKIKTNEELNLLNSKLKKFYIEQNQLIDSLLNPFPFEEDNEYSKLKIAIRGSVIVNILLFILQLYAAIKSGSLSIFATMSDALMDLMSSVILLLTERAANKNNKRLYPAGKHKLETVGIIIFSSLMSTVSFQLMIEGIKTLIKHKKIVTLDLGSILCLIISLSKAFYFKFNAKTLALDHRNDIIVNAFGITTSILGHYMRWWIDPIGCLFIALIILRSWVSTAIEQVELIVGKTADPDFLKKLTYLSCFHSEKISQVDNIVAYHSGTNYFVEVDIVLDPSTPLRESHDIGESLQTKLELLAEVDRAFVHVDYDAIHPPEH